MSTESLTMLIQAGISVIVGILALSYRKRLAQEMATKFVNVYGNLFKSEKVFESKFFRGYLEFGFILFGICAFIFAFLAFLNINN